uniref:Uncharacterized protein n=1 Tax=Anguilla anguilla TaxID=7936 RepID=A0A0E9WYD9_ANGAN
MQINYITISICGYGQSKEYLRFWKPHILSPSCHSPPKLESWPIVMDSYEHTSRCSVGHVKMVFEAGIPNFLVTKSLTKIALHHVK